MADYWVDGHHVTATDAESARAEFKRLHSREATELRGWTEGDQHIEDDFQRWRNLQQQQDADRLRLAQSLIDE